MQVKSTTKTYIKLPEGDCVTLSSTELYGAYGDSSDFHEDILVGQICLHSPLQAPAELMHMQFFQVKERKINLAVVIGNDVHITALAFGKEFAAQQYPLFVMKGINPCFV